MAPVVAGSGGLPAEGTRARPRAARLEAVCAALADPRRQRQVMLAGALLFGLALGAFLVIARGHPRSQWSMLDLEIYRWGGLRAREGFDAYRGTYKGLSYTYTPFALLLSAAGSFLQMAALRWLVTGLSVAALGAALWAAWGMVGVPRGEARVGLTLGVAGLAIWMEPVSQTLHFGQINLILMALVVLDLCQPDDRRWKGLGVGLAAAIKLTPGIFIPFLVLTRRWRAAVVSSATFAASLVLGFAVLPSASSKYWFGLLFFNSQRVGGVSYVSNQSLNGVLVRLLHGVNPAEPWWIVSGLLVGAFGLVLAVWASRMGEELLAVTLCALTGLLVSPISWSHHWTWIALGFVVALDLAFFRGYRAAWALLVGLAGLFAAGPVLLIWKVPNSNNREYNWHGWQLIVGNAYIIAGLALLAVAYAGLLRWWGAGRDHEGKAALGRRRGTGTPPSGTTPGAVLQRR